MLRGKGEEEGKKKEKGKEEGEEEGVGREIAGAVTEAAKSRAQIILERKIESITADLTPYFKSLMHSLSSKNEGNAATICDYIIAQNTEINPASNYRRSQIQTLVYISKHHYNAIPFKEMTRDDIINYLDSLRKPQEQDPMHKWIGTYNQIQVRLLRFFKWLYFPELPPKHRPTPDCMKHIVQLHRKEKSIYKASDLWTEQDDMLFIKYCKSKRDIAYHVLSRDSSCRPSELLNLKISDVHFKRTPDGTKQYAEILVSGKTGSRHIPLFYSVPYLKDWLDAHPYGHNPNAPLLPSLDVRHKRFGLKMKAPSMYVLYTKYRDEIFPALLNDPAVPPEDKIKIKDLIHNRKWNLYIRRHTALTEKAKILKEPILKAHSGWSQSSQMHLKYEHWFGNESSQALLEAYGVLTSEDSNPYIDTFKPKACPNCSESNIPDSKFCKKCRMVLTYDAFQETLEEQKKKDDRLATIEEQIKALMEFQQKIAQLKEKTQEEELQSAKTLMEYTEFENDCIDAGIIKEENRTVPKQPKSKLIKQLEQRGLLKKKKEEEK